MYRARNWVDDMCEKRQLEFLDDSRWSWGNSAIVVRKFANNAWQGWHTAFWFSMGDTFYPMLNSIGGLWESGSKIQMVRNYHL